MTLKKKFQILFNNSSVNENRVDGSVKIAKDFAIGFAEWLFDVSRIGTTKELLEIYKKENQL